MKVTAVLLNYKRPDELDKVIYNLKSKLYINEILVHDNSGDENIINYGRYVEAEKALNNTIYTQDDDCIVEDIDKLYLAYDGTEIVNGMKPERMEHYTGRTTMAGWGMFFDKRWIGILDLYINKYGKDYIFYRETDRIFTGLMPSHKTIGVSIKDFPSATSEFALYNQSNHKDCANEARRRVDEIVISST